MSDFRTHLAALPMASGPKRLDKTNLFSVNSTICISVLLDLLCAILGHLGQFSGFLGPPGANGSVCQLQVGAKRNTIGYNEPKKRKLSLAQNLKINKCVLCF